MKKKVFGVLLLMETFFLFLSVVVALYYGEGDFVSLAIATAACAVTGLFLFLPNTKEKANLNRKDCYMIIAGTWVVFSLFGMLPFLIYGTASSVTDAFFETMSGFTTTGASVFNNIDAQPHGLLFWRSIQQWMGGLGIVIFSIALLPSFNRNNKQLFSTEATSVSTSKLRPKTQEAARGILLIYVGLTFVCAFFYWIGPMGFYDALCHAMTTIGTGGFSTHQSSIAYFNSPYIEYVCSLFSFLGGVNFALYFYASRGNWRPLTNNEEFRWYWAGTLFFTVVFFVLFVVNPNLSTSPQMPDSLETELRTALFHTTTIFSSSGFQSTYCDYTSWGASFWMPTILLMVCGACAGSSSGGLKLIRFIICFKNMRNEFRLHKHPNAVFPVKISKHLIDDVLVRRTLAFIYIFIIAVVVGTTMLTFAGLDFDTAFGACISTISNTGPAFGTAGPISNYASLPGVAKWMCSALMLIGRLELYTILLMFTPNFWRD